jgi:hypothetical protein
MDLEFDFLNLTTPNPRHTLCVKQSMEPNDKNISPEESGRILDYLDKLDRRDKAVYNELETAIKKIIQKHYPDVFNLEAEGYRKLSDRISRSVWNIRREISDIIFHYKSK